MTEPAEHIARSTNLVVNDPHYSWAGSALVDLDAGPVRLVNITLDVPSVLTWAVVMFNGQPTTHFDPANFVKIKVTTGVSRATFTASGDLLGAYTGQVLAQTLQVSVIPRDDVPLTPPDKVQVVCLVTRGTAPMQAWPSQARLRQFGDVGGESVVIPATWRRGMRIVNATDPAVDGQVDVQIPQNLDGSGRRSGKFTILAGQALELPDYCGPVFVNAGAGSVPGTFCNVDLAEW